ncbi:MAG: hypothetical protein CVU38_03595 [Chloroflexi bacterium HGW-Chloroflexi-1]|nr:MAG: hypothetical protein CVU38_03595 [Chloroflexi bacterium HGW-Chloroflexi-1]
MPIDVTEIVVDRSRCARAEWPEEALLGHYEKRAREDPRIKSVTAYERMARDTIRKGHIFWFQHEDWMRIGFYNEQGRILTVVSGDQTRIITCITDVSPRYIERLFFAEGGGKLVDWPNCPFCWEI